MSDITDLLSIGMDVTPCDATSFRQTALPTYDEAVSPTEDTSSMSSPFNAELLLEVPDTQVLVPLSSSLPPISPQ